MVPGWAKATCSQAQVQEVVYNSPVAPRAPRALPHWEYWQTQTRLPSLDARLWFSDLTWEKRKSCVSVAIWEEMYKPGTFRSKSCLEKGSWRKLCFPQIWEPQCALPFQSILLPLYPGGQIPRLNLLVGGQRDNSITWEMVHTMARGRLKIIFMIQEVQRWLICRNPVWDTTRLPDEIHTMAGGLLLRPASQAW